MKLKKVLSVLLAVAMVLGTVSFPTFAENDVSEDASLETQLEEPSQDPIPEPAEDTESTETEEEPEIETNDLQEVALETNADASDNIGELEQQSTGEIDYEPNGDEIEISASETKKTESVTAGGVYLIKEGTTIGGALTISYTGTEEGAEITLVNNGTINGTLTVSIGSRVTGTIGKVSFINNGAVNGGVTLNTAGYNVEFENNGTIWSTVTLGKKVYDDSITVTAENSGVIGKSLPGETGAVANFAAYGKATVVNEDGGVISGAVTLYGADSAFVNNSSKEFSYYAKAADISSEKLTTVTASGTVTMGSKTPTDYSNNGIEAPVGSFTNNGTMTGGLTAYVKTAIVNAGTMGAITVGDVNYASATAATAEKAQAINAFATGTKISNTGTSGAITLYITDKFVNEGTVKGTVKIAPDGNVEFENNGTIWSTVTLGKIVYDDSITVTAANNGVIGKSPDNASGGVAGITAYGKASITNNDGGVISGTVTLNGADSAFVNNSSKEFSYYKNDAAVESGTLTTVTAVDVVTMGSNTPTKYSDNNVSAPVGSFTNYGTMTGGLTAYVKTEMVNAGTMGAITVGDRNHTHATAATAEKAQAINVLAAGTAIDNSGTAGTVSIYASGKFTNSGTVSTLTFNPESDVAFVNDGTTGSVTFSSSVGNVIFTNNGTTTAGVTIKGTGNVTFVNAGTVKGGATIQPTAGNVDFNNSGTIWSTVTLGKTVYDNSITVTAKNSGVIGKSLPGEPGAVANFAAYGKANVVNESGGVISGTVTLHGADSAFVNNSSEEFTYSSNGTTKTVTAVGNVTIGSGTADNYLNNGVTAPVGSFTNTGIMTGGLAANVKTNIVNEGTMGAVTVGNQNYAHTNQTTAENAKKINNLAAGTAITNNGTMKAATIYGNTDIVNNGKVDGGITVSKAAAVANVTNSKNAVITGAVSINPTGDAIFINNGDVQSTVTVSPAGNAKFTNNGTVKSTVAVQPTGEVEFENSGVITAGVTLGKTVYDDSITVKAVNRGVIGRAVDTELKGACTLKIYGKASVTNAKTGVISGTVTLYGNGSSFVNESSRDITHYSATASTEPTTVYGVGGVALGTTDHAQYANMTPEMQLTNNGIISGNVSAYVKSDIVNSGEVKGNVAIGSSTASSVINTLVDGTSLTNEAAGKLGGIVYIYAPNVAFTNNGAVTLRGTALDIRAAGVTLSGSGSVEGNVSISAVAGVTVNGGTYKGNIAVSEGGKLDIKGGSFAGNIVKYTDTAATWIAYKDGSDAYYVLPLSEIALTEALADGCAAVTYGGESYIIKKHSVSTETGVCAICTRAVAEAEIAGKKYLLEDALAIASDGDVIELYPGTYEPFTVTTPSLTIKAKDANNKPVIKTNYEGSPTYENWACGGVEVRTTGLVLENIIFESYGYTYGRWYAAPVGKYTESSGGNGIKILNCDFRVAPQVGKAAMTAIVLPGVTEMTVTGCTIEGFESGIYCEGTQQYATVNAVITDNKILVAENGNAISFVPSTNTGVEAGSIVVTGNVIEGAIAVNDWGIASADKAAIDSITLSNNTTAAQETVDTVLHNIDNNAAAVTNDGTSDVSNAYITIVKGLNYAENNADFYVNYGRSTEEEVTKLNDTSLVLGSNVAISESDAAALVDKGATISLNGNTVTAGSKLDTVIDSSASGMITFDNGGNVVYSVVEISEEAKEANIAFEVASAKVEQNLDAAFLGIDDEKKADIASKVTATGAEPIFLAEISNALVAVNDAYTNVDKVTFTLVYDINPTSKANDTLAYDINVNLVAANTKGETLYEKKLDLAGTAVKIILYTGLAVKTNVDIYHENTYIANEEVDADGNVTFTTTKGFSKYYIKPIAAAGAPVDIADSIKVSFEQVSEGVYNINLVGENGDIYRFGSTDLTFKLERGLNEYGEDADIAYTIQPADHISYKLRGTDNYSFYVNTTDNAVGQDVPYITGNIITLGTVTFTGYGNFSFGIDGAAEDTLLVNTALSAVEDENEAYSYTIAKGDLSYDNSATTDVTLEQHKKLLTVVVDYKNPIDHKNAEYTDMWITVEGDKDLVYRADLGSDKEVDRLSDAANKDVIKLIKYEKITGTTPEGKEDIDSRYIVQLLLPINTEYKITIQGDGYRTASKYYTLLDVNNTDVYFWNNVDLDGKASFLAGDIVKDNKINIYDLSAVVSYFKAENVTAANGYNQYDLNRDGEINTIDINWLLQSWDK